MAVKKMKPSTATRCNQYTFAYVDGAVALGEETIQEALNEAKDGCADGEIVEVYELVPRGRYTLGGWTEVK